MAITDPEVIKFCNQIVRPLAERLRADKAELGSHNIDWTEIQDKIPNSAEETIEDGREAEGASRLTGKDVWDLMYAACGPIKTAIEQVGATTINKPCVRPLRVE
jgi:hypothetical protein